VIVYAITNGIGNPSIATVTVRSQEGFNNPPIAYDAFADPEVGATTVTVDVLERCADPDGDEGDLEITEVFDEGATVSDGEITLTVTDNPRTVTYELRDGDGATALGLIHVSAPGSGPPYVRPGARIEIDRNGTESIDIVDYLIVPSGKTPRLTTTDRIWGAPRTGLTTVNEGDESIVLTAIGDYVGPGALVFEVTDGESLTDPDGRTTVVSIPVQVGPQTPVLHCPTEPLGVVQGGSIVTVDVTAVCHVWVADPDTRPGLRYSATWSDSAEGIDLGGSGEHSLTLAADSNAVPGTTGVVQVGVEDTDATPVSLPVVVLAAPLPAVSPAVVDGIQAGDSTTVDMARYVRSPLREPVVSVVAVAHTEGMPGEATFDGTRVTLTPDASSHGQMTFEVTVTDVQDTARGDRHTTGQITLNVLGHPDPPTNITIVEELNRSVRLAWDTPANNGAPIDVYEVSWDGGDQECSGSPCTITGLVNGSTYVFTVRAHNLVDWSPASAASPPAVPDTVPGAVTGLTAFNPQDGTLQLSWVAPSNEGTPIERYDVTWSGGGRQSASGNSLTAVGLNNNIQYTFTVVAVNAKGPGPGTQIVGQSAGAPPQPPAPTFQAVNSANANSRAVTVSWPAIDPNGPAPTTYTLVRSGGGTVTVCANVTATSCQDDGIANDGTIYTYVVTASNAAAAGGPGHTSPPSPGAVMEATATPDPITGYSISPTGVDGQASLTFNVPPSHGATSTTTCTWNGNSCGTWSYPVSGQAGVTRTITGLPNGQNVNVNLQTCNGSSGGVGAGTPCNTAVSAAVTTYGNMNSLSINGSANGATVNFTVSVNPNGKPASVRVQSAGRDNTFTTGVGAWSMNFADNVGYSSSDTITVTVTDPGRPTLTQQTTINTPPPPPSVTVNRGSACSGASCPGSGSCSGTCYFIVVTTANFGGNVTCSFNSSLGSAGWSPLQFGPNENRQTGYWYGVPSGWVTVTCNGVQGTRNPWGP
jgi:hypothetical protein